MNFSVKWLRIVFYSLELIFYILFGNFIFLNKHVQIIRNLFFQFPIVFNWYSSGSRIHNVSQINLNSRLQKISWVINSKWIDVQCYMSCRRHLLFYIGNHSVHSTWGMIIHWMMYDNWIRFIIFFKTIYVKIHVDLWRSCIRNYRIGLNVLNINIWIQNTWKLHWCNHSICF